MKRRVERTWVLYDMTESCPFTRLGGFAGCLVWGVLRGLWWLGGWVVPC